MKLPRHGSNPQYVYQEMGIEKPDNLIDLSANINPLGPPKRIEENWMNFFHEINDYPDPYANKLKEIIAKQEGLEEDSILIGNGGAEIISLLGRFLSGKNVLIIEPAFSEYEKACEVNGCNIFYHYTKEPNWELEIHDITDRLSEMDAVFLCNPNNPTGVYYSYQTIVSLLAACKKTNTMLIIDEAFYDFVQEYTKIAPLVLDHSNIVILRSMTKMFAIPGIRLGYLIGAPSLVKKMAKYQAHWSVNSLAMSVGELILSDEAFVDDTKQFISKERIKILSFLENEGFETSPSMINFYLLRDPQCDNIMDLYTFLLKNGIVPRHTFNFPGLEGKWLRFAIKSTEENNKLMEVLKEWKQLP